jgi:hypothetical protein
VACPCNPNYSGARDQEDGDSKPALGLSQKKKITKKRAGGVAQGVDPEFKHQNPKNNKKKKKKKKAGTCSKEARLGGVSGKGLRFP